MDGTTRRHERQADRGHQAGLPAPPRSHRTYLRHKVRTLDATVRDRIPLAASRNACAPLNRRARAARARQSHRRRDLPPSVPRATRQAPTSHRQAAPLACTRASSSRAARASSRRASTCCSRASWASSPPSVDLSWDSRAARPGSRSCASRTTRAAPPRRHQRRAGPTPAPGCPARRQLRTEQGQGVGHRSREDRHGRFLGGRPSRHRHGNQLREANLRGDRRY